MICSIFIHGEKGNFVTDARELVHTLTTIAIARLACFLVPSPGSVQPRLVGCKPGQLTLVSRTALL
jgi:hypothetical protein